MRLLLALAVAVFIMGGLQAYLTWRPQPHGPSEVVEAATVGGYDLELTLTFAAGADPFALNASSAPSVEVLLGQAVVLRRTGEVPPGEPLVISNVPGVTEGQNELFVRVTPQEASANVARAIRVRVLKNGVAAADETLWSAPGDVVQGTLQLNVPRPASEAPPP